MGQRKKLRAGSKKGRVARIGPRKGEAGRRKRATPAAPHTADAGDAGAHDGGSRDSVGRDGSVGTVPAALRVEGEDGGASTGPAKLNPGWADALGQVLAAEERKVPRRQYKRSDEQRFNMSIAQRARWAARKGQCSG